MSEPRPPRPTLRERQQQAQDEARRRASYDAYPGTSALPRVQLFLVAFAEGESFDGEQVDTDGLSAREFIPGLTLEKRRRWLVARVMAAHDRLLERIEPAEAGEPT